LRNIRVGEHACIVPNISLAFVLHIAIHCIWMPEKPAISFRLTEKAQALLLKIAEESGIAQSAVIETMIREKAKSLNIELEEPPV
jgi:hypothetical protein